MDILDIARVVTIYIVTVWLPPIIGNILSAIAVVYIGYRAIHIINRVLTAAAHRNLIKSALIDLMTATVSVAGWILIVGGVLRALQLNELAIAVGGSVSFLSLGVAAAASGNLGDIIAGVFLASDPDFGAGFVIRTGEVEGMIEHIDLRKTRIRAPDGRLHIIPNKSIESTVWIVEQRPATPAHPTGLSFPSLPRRRPTSPQKPSSEQNPPTNPPAKPTGEEKS